jgi:hypothetical protein
MAIANHEKHEPHENNRRVFDGMNRIDRIFSTHEWTPIFANGNKEF